MVNALNHKKRKHYIPAQPGFARRIAYGCHKHLVYRSIQWLPPAKAPRDTITIVASTNPKTGALSAAIRAAIMKIPRGKVSTYGGVGRAAGLPQGARLVVRVLRQSHGLPWHRVVGAGGRIATPGEHALDQRFRLEMEGVKFSGKKVRMAEFEFKFPRKRAAKKKKKTVERRRPRLR